MSFNVTLEMARSYPNPAGYFTAEARKERPECFYTIYREVIHDLTPAENEKWRLAGGFRPL